jgi:anti-sigma regulatory factor (Ser/Thr protein kinase)
MKEKIIIKNEVSALNNLTSKVEELSERWELPMPLSMNINLVLEEAVSNIIFYAFTDKKAHEIQIEIALNNEELTLIIEDEGIPFDPTTKKAPDISLPADERPIGGLGIFLISKIMDHVSYQRDENKNRLTLKKKIKL